MLKFIRSGLSQPLKKKKKKSLVKLLTPEIMGERNKTRSNCNSEQRNYWATFPHGALEVFLLKTRYGIVELTHVNSIRCKIMKGRISMAVKATWNGGTALSRKLRCMGNNWPHSHRCKQGFLPKQVRAFRSLSRSLSSRASKSEQNSAKNPGLSSASQFSAFLRY